MYHVLRSVSSVLSPILPHVTHELSLCARVMPRVSESGWYCEDTWRDEELAHVLNTLETIREELNKMDNLKVGESLVVISVQEEVFNKLQLVESSQVAEVLGTLSAQVINI